MNTTNKKVTVSLPVEILSYADQYKEAHSLATRSEVLTLALKLLREKELEAGYRALAEEYAKNPDPLMDSGLEETLDMIEEG